MSTNKSLVFVFHIHDSSTMNNNVNANGEGGHRDGERNQNNEVRVSFFTFGLVSNSILKIPPHLLQHTPRPREVIFTLTVGQLVSDATSRELQR